MRARRNDRNRIRYALRHSGPTGSSRWASPHAPPRSCLSVTNHLTQNVAAIPFLWVLPLSLYLLSFILCFDSDRWYQRWLFSALRRRGASLAGLRDSNQSDIGDLRLAIGVFSLLLFVLSWYVTANWRGGVPSRASDLVLPDGFGRRGNRRAVHRIRGVLPIQCALRSCRRDLAHRIPARLSALAGAPTETVTDIIPRCALRQARDRDDDRRSGGLHLWRRRGANGRNDVSRAPLRFLGSAGHCRVSDALCAVAWTRIDGRWLIMCAIAAGLAVGITGFLARDTWNSISDSRVLARNFYGALKVYDSESDGTMGTVRTLRHGTIDHGEEFLAPQYERFATTYYARNSGVGLAIQSLQLLGPMNVGVIGLGAGTLTTYGRPSIITRFTTSIPWSSGLRKRSSGSCATAWPNTKSSWAMRAYPRNRTFEAVRRARRGRVLRRCDSRASADPRIVRSVLASSQARRILAVHVSNKYLALGPVVALAAAEDGKQAMMFSNPADDNTEVAASDWVLVSSRPGFFDRKEIKAAEQKIQPIPGLRTWTDDYSNLYKILH